MSHRLNRTSAATCIRIGYQVGDRLATDARLAEPTARFQERQAALVARFGEWEAAERSAAASEEQRDRALRDLGDGMREFALALLALTRNDHRDERYVRYFGDGYGPVMRYSPAEADHFTEVILNQLQNETDPAVAAHRELLAARHAAFRASEETCQSTRRAERLAWDYLEAEKRLWSRGMHVARLEVEKITPDEIAYIRWIFRPGVRRGSSVAPGEAEPQPAAQPSEVAVMNTGSSPPEGGEPDEQVDAAA